MPKIQFQRWSLDDGFIEILPRLALLFDRDGKTLSISWILFSVDFTWEFGNAD